MVAGEKESVIRRDDQKRGKMEGEKMIWGSGGGGGGEDRQTDRQTDRQRQRDCETE